MKSLHAYVPRYGPPAVVEAEEDPFGLMDLPPEEKRKRQEQIMEAWVKQQTKRHFEQIKEGLK